jgi:type I restriction enzyme S subunit
MAAKWRVTTLEKAPLEIIDGDRGTNYPNQAEFSATGHCLFLNAGNVTTTGFRFSDCAFITAGKDASLRKGKLIRNDVVLTTRGTVGNAAYFDDSVPFGQIRINSGMVILRAQTPALEPRYLYLFVRSAFFHAQVSALRTGSAQPQLPIRDINRIEIPIPPPDEQRSIAHILGTLDDKIELNRRTNETLEAMARALFKSWFVDFDPVRAKAEGHDPGLAKPLADLFPDSFEDSELGEIPKGWEVGTLGMLGELAIGGDWGEDEAFAGAVGASCLRGVDLENLRHLGHASAPRRWFKPSSLERRAMDDRDVLVAGSGAGPTGRPLWMCTDLLQALGPCVYSNFCKRIRCGTAARAVYLDAWLHSMRVSGEIWDHVNGTSIPNLDANSLLAGKEVPIPPMPVLDKYHDFVHPIWQEKYAGENDTLAALRDTLLHKLISGELRVKDAEELLARTDS